MGDYKKDRHTEKYGCIEVWRCRVRGVCCCCIAMCIVDILALPVLIQDVYSELY